MKTEIALDRQAKGAERAAVTLESLIEKASQILDLAIAEKQFSAAVAALQEVGTLSGLRIERREVGRPGDFERHNELRAQLAEWPQDEAKH
jgi:hypothetical protein